MTDYINYTLVNATSLSDALLGSATSFETGTGYDLFFPFVLLLFILGGAVMGAKYGQAKAMTYAALIGDIIGFMMVAAGLLDPIYLILIVVITMPLLFVKDD